MHSYTIFVLCENVCLKADNQGNHWVPLEQLVEVAGERATQTLISGRQQDMMCENNLYNLGNLRASFHLKYHIKPISNQIKQTAGGLTKWRTQSEHNYLPACACRRSHLSCIVLYMSQHSMITQRPFPVSTQDSMFVLSRENVDVLALHTRVHDNKM